MKIVTPNERVEKEAAIRSDILHFFCQRNFTFIREKSEFEKDVWQPIISFGQFTIAPGQRDRQRVSYLENYSSEYSALLSPHLSSASTNRLISNL